MPTWPPKEQSCHTRDLADWAYQRAHEVLAEEGEPCPYPEMVARVARCLRRDPAPAVEDAFADLERSIEDLPRRQAALDQFKAAFGKDATLLDACLDLRMACSGACDPISDEGRATQVAALEVRLAVWEPRGEPWRRFDEAVRELVRATIAEVRS